MLSGSVPSHLSLLSVFKSLEGAVKDVPVVCDISSGYTNVFQRRSVGFKQHIATGFFNLKSFLHSIRSIQFRSIQYEYLRATGGCLDDFGWRLRV